ncbi:MAG: ribonuclease H-like domain-containing protein, partial [Chloroflexi bacterium]|nr:ribonuclease H-like domain-containing protein [Chloroflexota bacterium]
RPHLDLLPPARRLWRGRLGSCALSSLEVHALGVLRGDDDVPGYLIPGMYVDYLRTGDAREMLRVLYHNAVDVLSMVTLAAHLMEAYARPAAGAASPAESLAVARWREADGDLTGAEAGYRAALAGDLPTPDRAAALGRLAALLKRGNRRAQAVPLWESLAALAPDDPAPCVELAMYHEWETGDPYGRAVEWTVAGLLALTYWKKGWRLDKTRAELEHRLARLQRKIGATYHPP